MSRWFAIVEVPPEEPRPGMLDRAWANTRKRRARDRKARAAAAAAPPRRHGAPRVLKGVLDR